MRILGAWIAASFLIGHAIANDRAPAAAAKAAGTLDARALAARVDVRLAEAWAEAGATPAARSGDGEFLRRASLDLIGKIPTAAEARDFLDDPSPEKRAALVGRLLESPAYAMRAASLWREILLPNDQAEGQPGLGVNELEAWLRKKVREEAGYDRVVREILTVKLSGQPGDSAMGRSAAPSPAAFYAAKLGKPEVIAADSARAFLGLRLECAQCHHHPFAKWKREEFWAFSAFFAGVPTDPNADGVTTPLRPANPNRRELTIPGTSTVVAAGHLDHTPPAWRPRAEPREVLAEWITAPGNPYFARAAVNRTWARFLGSGLIEPIDDLDSGEDSGLGGLLDELADQFRAHGYDMKYLIRALTSTRAYHLTSVADPGHSTAPAPFARMPVRGLSPGQFVDSLARATGVELAESRGRFLELFADRDARPTEAQASILQALTLMNGSFVAGATSPEAGDTLGAIAEAPYLDDEGRVEALYLTTLARRPSAKERGVAVAYLEKRAEAGRPRALSDIFWALLNGPEFRVNH